MLDQIRQEYMDFLNEHYDPIEVGGLQYSYGESWYKLDPIAFEQGFNDWADAQGVDIYEHGG